MNKLMVRKTALVTGGTGGLGEAISARLHDDGYAVVVTYSRQNVCVEGWLARMDQEGRHFHAYAVDVAEYNSCERLAARILSEVGPVDILVNNAGIARDAMFRKMTHTDWELVLRTNLDSVFNMTRHLCDAMIQRGWGRIVNVASVVGSKGGVGQANYAAAKAGIHGFTKSLALELAGKGITVNTISPGYIETPIVSTVSEEILKSRILPQIPMGRLGQPDEVAALVAYLCSQEAGFVTGANFAINGGQHLQ